MTRDGALKAHLLIYCASQRRAGAHVEIYVSADTYLLLYPLRVRVTLSQPPPRRRLAHCTLPTVLKS